MNNSLRFISFEGLDFSGKSTQIKFLIDHLHTLEQKVCLLREPGGTQISEKIRGILLDKKHMHMTDVCEVLLYSAARHQLASEKIKDELDRGTFVIADRYVDSTTAYQGYGRQLPMEFIVQLNSVATDDLMPSITFFLDIDLQTLAERRNIRKSDADRLESQKNVFYERIRKGYLKIAELNKTRYIVIDGTLSIEIIKKQIWEYISQRFGL